jgi:hypothetical protein
LSLNEIQSDQNVLSVRANYTRGSDPYLVVIRFEYAGDFRGRCAKIKLNIWRLIVGLLTYKLSHSAFSLKGKERRPFTADAQFTLVRVIPALRSDTHQHPDGDAQCVALSGTELADKVDQLDRNLVAVDRVVVSPASVGQDSRQVVKAAAHFADGALGAAHMRRSGQAMDRGLGGGVVKEGH